MPEIIVTPTISGISYNLVTFSFFGCFAYLILDSITDQWKNKTDMSKKIITFF